MDEPRIIIAYDDSAGAEAALHDLRCAGLGQHAHALLVTADVANPAMLAVAGDDDDIVEQSHVRSEHIASSGADELHSIYPGWEIATETWPGPADEAILNAAGRFGADLIVIGWNERPSKERLWRHSVALSVLRRAHCTVRIGRHSPDSPVEAKRVIVGIDGSPNSRAAIEAVLSRHWSSGTTVQVVAALTAPFMEHAITKLMMPESELQRLDERRRELREEAASAVMRLERAGLNAAGNIRVGDPLQILLDAASSWRAGAIFLGASGTHGRDDSHIASIAFTVAERAPCAVEVVRG